MTRSTKKTKPAAIGLDAAFASLDGMSSLLSQDITPPAPHPDASTTGPMVLPLDQVHPDPDQPRRTFDEAALAELAESIQAQGVLQPIIVRPHPTLDGEWVISFGERRWRAAQLAGLAQIPALQDERSESERLLAQIVENVQREDLTPTELVMGYGRLKNDHGMKAADIARQAGKSKQVIGEYLAVLDMPEQYRQALADGAVRDVTALNALWRLGEKHPQQATALLESATPDKPITRALVRTIGEEAKAGGKSTAAVLGEAGSTGSSGSATPPAAGEGKTPTAPAAKSDGEKGAGEGGRDKTTSMQSLPVGIKVRYDGDIYWLRYDSQRDVDDRRHVMLANDAGLTLYAPIDELVITDIHHSPSTSD